MTNDWSGKTNKKKVKKRKSRIAVTPQDYQMGLINGKSIFPFSHDGPHNMTMNPAGQSIPYPIRYEGYNDGQLVDSGIAMPNTDFMVEGDTVMEYPLAQMGVNIPTTSWSNLGQAPSQQMMPGMQYQEGDWQLNVQDAFDVYNNKADKYSARGGYESFPPSSKQDSQLVAGLNEERFGQDNTKPNVRNFDFKTLHETIKQKMAKTEEEQKSLTTEAVNSPTEANSAITKKSPDEGNIWADFVGKEGKVRLQKMLADLGFYEGPIDGILARLSGDAVQKFQETYGLKADRIAGVNTLRKLKDIYKTYEELNAPEQSAIDKGQDGTYASGPFGMSDVEALRKLREQMNLGLNASLPTFDETGVNIAYGKQPYSNSDSPFLNHQFPDVTSKIWDDDSMDQFSRTYPGRYTPSTGINMSPNNLNLGLTNDDGEVGTYNNNQFNDPNALTWTDLPFSALYNLGRGFLEKPQKYGTEYNEYAPQYLSGLQSLKFTPDFNPLRLAHNTGADIIKNSSTNVGSMLANQANLLANTQSQMSNVIRASDQMNNQYMTNYLNALNVEGQNRVNARLQSRDLNDRAKAARNEFRAAGMAQLDDFGSSIRDLGNQRQTNELTMAMLNSQNPNFMVFPDENGNLISYYRNPETGEIMPINNNQTIPQNTQFKPFGKKRKKSAKRAKLFSN